MSKFGRVWVPATVLAMSCASPYGGSTDGDGGASSVAASSQPSDAAAAWIAATKARFRIAGRAVLADAQATDFSERGDHMRAEVPDAAAAGKHHRSDVMLPSRGDAPFRVTDRTSGVAIDVTLEGAVAATAEIADGYVLYRNAHESGADVVHRVTATGTEDYVLTHEASPVDSLRYTVALGESVAGLRLVGGSLEVLDDGGAPRLRVRRPYLVDAEGTRHDAELTVEGCAYDSDPRAPWGRPATAPGG